MKGANTNTWWFDQQHMSSRVEHVKLLKMPNLKIFELPMLLHFLVCGSETFGLKFSWKTCRLFWTWRGSGKSGTVMMSYGKLWGTGAPFWILQLARTSVLASKIGSFWALYCPKWQFTKIALCLRLTLWKKNLITSSRVTSRGLKAVSWISQKRHGLWRDFLGLSRPKLGDERFPLPLGSTKLLEENTAKCRVSRKPVRFWFQDGWVWVWQHSAFSFFGAD